MVNFVLRVVGEQELLRGVDGVVRGGDMIQGDGLVEGGGGDDVEYGVEVGEGDIIVFRGYDLGG